MPILSTDTDPQIPIIYPQISTDICGSTVPITDTDHIHIQAPILSLYKHRSSTYILSLYTVTDNIYFQAPILSFDRHMWYTAAKWVKLLTQSPITCIPDTLPLLTSKQFFVLALAAIKINAPIFREVEGKKINFDSSIIRCVVYVSRALKGLHSCIFMRLFKKFWRNKSE